MGTDKDGGTCTKTAIYRTAQSVGHEIQFVFESDETSNILMALEKRRRADV